MESARVVSDTVTLLIDVSTHFRLSTGSESNKTHLLIITTRCFTLHSTEIVCSGSNWDPYSGHLLWTATWLLAAERFLVLLLNHFLPCSVQLTAEIEKKLSHKRKKIYILFIFLPIIIDSLLDLSWHHLCLLMNIVEYSKFEPFTINSKLTFFVILLASMWLFGIILSCNLYPSKIDLYLNQYF